MLMTYESRLYNEVCLCTWTEAICAFTQDHKVRVKSKFSEFCIFIIIMLYFITINLSV